MVQLQVVYALILRETRTRFGTHRLGYVWALCEPVIFIATFAAMYLVIGRLVPWGLDVVPFLTTGFVPFGLFREAANRSLNAISSNRGLLFYPQVRPLDLVLARVILEFATHFIVFCLIMGALCIYEWRIPDVDLLKILVGLTLAFGLGASLGLIMCSLSVFSPTFERLLGPSLRPLFWASGLFYAPSTVPPAARQLLLYNPMVHVIELVRDGWFERYSPAEIGVTYPLLWIAALLLAGLGLERVARRRIQLT
jgi:capsular polysaccharide transport system permease protein